MDYKLVLSLLTIPLTVALFWPYLRDVFKGITKPHIYTWLIWSITMTVALIGGYQAGAGKLLFITLGISVIFVFFTFLLCFKYGTSDITKFDTVILILALSSVGTFIFIDNALWAIVLASLADALGYIPTYRKSFISPYSETLIFWFGSIVMNILAIGALLEYNASTLLYLGTILAANLLLCVILIGRRQYLNKIK